MRRPVPSKVEGFKLTACPEPVEGTIARLADCRCDEQKPDHPEPVEGRGRDYYPDFPARNPRTALHNKARE